MRTHLSGLPVAMCLRSDDTSHASRLSKSSPTSASTRPVRISYSTALPDFAATPPPATRYAPLRLKRTQVTSPCAKGSTPSSRPSSE